MSIGHEPARRESGKAPGYDGSATRRPGRYGIGAALLEPHATRPLLRGGEAAS